MNPYLGILAPNQFTGTIPSEINALTLLTTINLQRNLLTTINLQSNLLTGTIPTMVGAPEQPADGDHPHHGGGSRANC